MQDLIDWLHGVLDDIEAAAEAASQGPWKITKDPREGTTRVMSSDPVEDLPGHFHTVTDDEGGTIPPSPEDATHIALHDPAAVLADVAAKKAILDAYLPEDGDPHPGLPCINYEGQNPEHYSEWDTCSRHIKANETRIRQDFVIRLLASAYRHRPGWKQEWEDRGFPPKA